MTGIGEKVAIILATFSASTYGSLSALICNFRIIFILTLVVNKIAFVKIFTNHLFTIIAIFYAC